MLSIWPQLSKSCFLSFFSHSRSEQFWKQNTNTTFIVLISFFQGYLSIIHEKLKLSSIPNFFAIYFSFSLVNTFLAAVFSIMPLLFLMQPFMELYQAIRNGTKSSLHMTMIWMVLLKRSWELARRGQGQTCLPFGEKGKVKTVQSCRSYIVLYHKLIRSLRLGNLQIHNNCSYFRYFTSKDHYDAL